MHSFDPDFRLGAIACQRSPPGGHSGGVGPTRSRRLEQLFREHHARVLAYAARRVPARADDVVGEVFAVAWRRIDDVPADAEAWLYAVARRVIAGQFRSQARQDALVTKLCELRPHAADPGDDDPQLHELLDRLGETDREALLLLYWEGLSPQRAAVSLGISRDAFNQRAHRARMRLRALSLETEIQR
jgi:RNA polymerase sigma-70 factor (ECF subfamily)